GDRRWRRGTRVQPAGPQPRPCHRRLLRGPGSQRIMTITETRRELKDGRIVAIAGPVVDVEFPPDAIPELDTALEMTVGVDGHPVAILAEVAQQIGGAKVRAICMRPTDGLRRGAPVRNLGHGLSVPVGDEVLGHIFNVWGEPLDTDPEKFAGSERWDIHRDPPPFDEL